MFEWIQANQEVLIACGIPLLVLIADAIVKWTQTKKDDAIWQRIKESLPIFKDQPKGE